MSGPSCKDDSKQGPQLMDDGPGRKSLLTYLEGQMQRSTKAISASLRLQGTSKVMCCRVSCAVQHSTTEVIIVENVVSGTIQRLTAEYVTRSGLYWAKTIHGDTWESGYGACRRQRGWLPGCTIHAGIRPVQRFRV